MRTNLAVAVGITSIVIASQASAQGTAPPPAGPPPGGAVAGPPPGAPPPGAPPPNGAPNQPPPQKEGDDVRFRFGVSGGGGAGFYTVTPTTYTAILFGMDLRLGVQIMNLIAVYAQPHLSFGPISGGGVSSFTGVFAGTAMAELTLIDRIFVGAGAGGGVLNNPSGFALQFRAGGYPLMSKTTETGRRKGLSIGMDLRIIFASGVTAISPFFSIGYEAF